MTLSLASTTVDDWNTEASVPRRSRARLSVSLAAAIATAIVALGLMSGPGKPARGDDKDPSKPGASVPDPRSYQAFISEIQRILTRNEDRLIEIVNPILDNAEASDRIRTEIVSLELQVRSAEARLHSANLDREVAELTLDEYQKVASAQEKVAVETELKRATDRLERARKAVSEAMDRLAQIRALMKKESASDKDMENNYTFRVTTAQFEERRAEAAVVEAEVKKNGFLHPRWKQRLRDLRAEIEKARAEELAKQASWELAKGRLDQAKKSLKRAGLTEVQRYLLALVQQAFPIQDAIEAKRDQLAGGGKPDESLQTALRDLTNQLESLGEQVGLEQAGARFANLKPQVHWAARPSPSRTGLFGFLRAANPNKPSKPALDDEKTRSQPGAPAPEKASHQRLGAEAQQPLNAVYDRLIGLAERVLKDPTQGQLQDQLVNQRIETESAKASYQTSKLTREVAEIAITEYTGGIFPSDLATVEMEIIPAHSDLQRGRDIVEFAKDQLARSKERAAKSVLDLHRQYFYADAVAEAEQEDRKRADLLEQFEAKKKLLLVYTKPKRLKELQIEVEKACATELANQAKWEIAKAREARLEKMIHREDPAEDHRRVLALIERAIPIEEQIRAKLPKLAKAEKPDDLPHKEIEDLTNELRAIVDQGEAVQSAGEFAGLKPRIEEAIRRTNSAAAK